MGLYIQKLPDGTWGNMLQNGAFDSQTKEELKSQGWYKLVLDDAPFIDLNMKCDTKFVVRDDVVYREHTLTLKTGDELEEAIKMKWITCRLHRNNLLKESDYTQLFDIPMTEEKKAEWVDYRQKLRDITSTSNDPFNLLWPIDPNGHPSAPQK